MTTTPPRIRPLPPLLIDQIAAGEVVERPASAVKELIENSLDAGARRIEIELEAGGARRIRVSDDGCGIAPEDLPLALARHATSKIAAAEDLDRVRTLGFRGEALAALAAVARVRITTRPRGEPHAYAILAEEGLIGSVGPAAGPFGTTVEVDDLFFNVPARRRFLRGPRTELAHVRQWLDSIALAHPAVQFRLVHEGRELLCYRPAEPYDRCREVLGEELAATLLPVAGMALGTVLQGWIAPPAACSGRSDLQFFLVNGRPVKDRGLAHAVRAAYRDVLHHERQPIHVLELRLDPMQVDVNVHPAKREVRFREARLVHDLVQRALEQALAETRALVSASPAMPARGARTAAASQAEAPSFEHKASPLRLSELAALYLPASTPAGEQAAFACSQPLAEARPLALLRGTWLLAEDGDGLLIIDAHAAHERVLYERLKQELLGGALRAQSLLVPLELAVTELEAEAAERHGGWLEKHGFEVDRIAPAKVALRARPALLAEAAEAERALRALLAELAEFERETSGTEAVERALATIACHAAWRAGTRMPEATMRHLLESLPRTERSGQCNHGRPTWVRIPWPELDRMFLRGR